MKQHDPIFFTPPSGSMRNRRLFKGGGDAAYYKNAEKLYGVQADTAQFMLDIGKEALPGAVDRYQTAAMQYQDPAYAERMAGQAATTAQQSIDQTSDTMRRNMARYGFNPASGKWAGMERTNAIQGAALKAGAVNQALTNVEDKKFGAAKDFYSSMVGMPSDAAAQAGNAASGFANLGQAKQNQAAQESQGLSNIASLGYMALTMRDGGEVKKPAKGYGARMASGGLFQVGTQPVQVPTAPAPQQQQPSISSMKTAAQMIQEGPGGFAKSMAAKGGKMMENLGNWTGNAELSAQGLGTQATAAGQDLTGAIQAYKGAGMNDVAGGLAKGAGDAGTIAMNTSAEQGAMLAAQNAGVEGATAATADALAGSAAGAEAAGAAAGAAEGAGALSGALAGVSTVMPWLAAGAAVGSLLGLFADGGEVERENMVQGGKVDGPGGETGDKIPAWLSDGEFVVNAKSVKMPGVKPMLEKINAAGLAKRYGANGFAQRAGVGIGHADGGMVERMYRAFRGKSEKTEDQKRAEMAEAALGEGKAKQAANALKNRKQQLDEELRKQVGYACGGAVKKRGYA